MPPKNGQKQIRDSFLLAKRYGNRGRAAVAGSAVSMTTGSPLKAFKRSRLGEEGGRATKKSKKPNIAIVSCLKTLTKQSKTLLHSLGVDAVADEGLEAASLHKCSKTPKSSKTKMRKRLLLKST